MSSNKTLAMTLFEERIAKIRVRFISKLADTMRVTDADLPRLAGDGVAAIEAVATVCRQFHNMAGICATLGFETTGHVAETLDALLIGPFRDQRGLQSEELAKLKSGLDALRIAALTEIQPKDRDQESAS